MAKKKVVRRTRIPNDHCRMEIVLPRETCERIVAHCKRNNIAGDLFLKKAIYNALPVHYEVTEDFIFPFGKYQGETAGAVMQFDPDYIDWCKKNINGFKNKMEPEVARATSLPHIFAYDKEVAEALFRPHLKPGEHVLANNSGRVWAYRPTSWGQKSNWRKLGTWEPTTR